MIVFLASYQRIQFIEEIRLDLAALEHVFDSFENQYTWQRVPNIFKNRTNAVIVRLIRTSEFTTITTASLKLLLTFPYPSVKELT